MSTNPIFQELSITAVDSKSTMHMFVKILILLFLVFSSHSYDTCRFALHFTRNQLLNDPVARNQFQDLIAFWEGKFHQHRIGYNAKSGMSYDGHRLDFVTGLPEKDGIQFWSASSKEALHLHMLTLALEGNERALLFMHAANCTQNSVEYCKRTIDRSKIEEQIIHILTTKIHKYEIFNQKYPGFGGHLPWIFVDDDGFEPASDWTHATPSLDNGELAFAIYALLPVLMDKGYNTLAARYRSWFSMMAKYAATIFYEGDGKVRTVATIKYPERIPFKENYAQQKPCGPCYLDDPYEGELMVWLLEFFGTLDKNEIDSIWKLKRGKLQSVEYPTPMGPITCQRGWWFSSHEQWKYLVMPYLDVPINRRIFINGEKARTWNSALKKIPGMYASVGNVTHGTHVNGGYLSAAGIQEIAFEPVLHRNVITPYSTFPVFLADPVTALVWYHNMLIGSKMQNPYGSTESVTVDGKRICPLVTWDSKITSLIAMLGGVGHLSARQLKKDGKYELFYNRVNEEWSRVFTNIRGEELEFALPTVAVPNILQNFTMCN